MRRRVLAERVRAGWAGWRMPGLTTRQVEDVLDSVPDGVAKIGGRWIEVVETNIYDLDYREILGVPR